MAQKIVGLDNLKVIKSYIDRVRGEISNELDSSTKQYLDDQLAKASDFITKDYEAKYKDLMERIEYVEQFGNEEELKQLQLQLDALVNNTNDMHNALEGLDRELSRLNGDYENLYEGVTSGSIFSAGQLDEIIKTAMIDHTTITDDGIWTPNVFTQKIVALIGNFGQIKAANIVGGDISGHTISSNNTITGTNDPVWRIGNAGEGYLASKSISWDADGKVTFGAKARMDWDNIDGKPNLENISSGISVFTSTVFKRTNIKPDAPEGGSYEDPRPNDYTWEDGIPTGEAILWASTRVFASDAGELQHKFWSEPAQMTDTADFEVIYSKVEEPANPTNDFFKDEDGGIAGWLANNPDWMDDATTDTIWMATIKASNGVWSGWKVSKIKGEKGTDGDSAFVSTVFRRTNAKLTAEDTPTGGSYVDPYPEDVDENGNLIWSDGIPEGGAILWASTATFCTNPELNIPWTAPAQMTDTADFEAIYSAKTLPTAPTNDFYKDEDGGIAGWLANNPDWTDDGDVNSIWMATSKASNGEWEDWKVLKIKGEDGDTTFLSTVFTRTNTIPTTPTGGSFNDPLPEDVDENGNLIWSDGIPEGKEIIWMSTRLFSSDESINTDWTIPAQMSDTAEFEVIYSRTIEPAAPANEGFSKDADGNISKEWLYDNPDWTDDPEADSIWMATNKASNGVWDGWKVFKIKGEKGETGDQGIAGVSTFKSTVFKRTNDVLTIVDTPTGGSYDRPTPDDTSWTDGIPEGQEILWASTATFSTDPNMCKPWSTPAQMTDTSDFEVIYNTRVFATARDAYDSIPAGFKKSADENGIAIDPDWLTNAQKEGWQDDGSVDSTWMASIKASNGVWGDWSVSKIKGEDGRDGKDGKDGKSVNVKGRFATFEELMKAYPTGPENPSDAYVVGLNLYVWDGTKWVDAGKFCGEDGISKFKSTVFRRTNIQLTEEHRPEGGSFDSPLPIGDLWTDGIPDGDQALWMSSRIFSSDGNHQEKWTAPAKMSDTVDLEILYCATEQYKAIPKDFKKNGIDIDSEWLSTANTAGWYDEVEDLKNENNEPAPAIWMAINKASNGEWLGWEITRVKGEDGQDGLDGADGFSTFRSTVFRRTNLILTADDTPTGGSYDRPIPDGTVWSDGVEPSEAILWMSHRVFSNDPTYQSSWTAPIKLTDSTDLEIMYSPNAEKPNMPAGFKKSINENGIAIDTEWLVLAQNAGWFDEDTDFSGDAIWMAVNKASNGVWGGWKITKIKGEKGEDGQSGEDGKPINYLGESDKAPSNPQTNDCYKNTTDGWIYVYVDGMWQKMTSDGKAGAAGKDGKDGNNIYITYHDNPVDNAPEPPTGTGESGGWHTTSNDKCIWISQKVAKTAEEGTWGAPVQWRGKDGISKFKSTVYRRSNTKLTAVDTPTGGSLAKPIPDGGIWFDGIPSGEEMLWASTRTFSSIPNDPDDTGWSAPAQMSDTASFEVIYGTEDASLERLPNRPITEGMSNASGWYDNAEDVPSDKTIVYMATATSHNGKWSNWSISKIKGENGEDGLTTYVYIKYAKEVEKDDAGNVTKLVLTADDGDSPEDAIWMGVGNGTVEQEPDANSKIYKWTKVVADPIITPVKFKSTVFTRRIPGQDISGMIPTGGSYSNPIPDGAIYNGLQVVWSDGVPEIDQDNAGTVIWSTTRTFMSDDSITEDAPATWSNPKPMIDNPAFETAYGTSECTNLDGSINTDGLPVDASGRACPPSVNNTYGYTHGWVDEPIPGVQYEYMATATYETGKWSTWAVYRIKGEKGDRGTGIKYKATLNTIGELPSSQSIEGEAYVIRFSPIDVDDKSWNHLFVWTGLGLSDNVYDEVDGIYRGWSDAGRFLGEDGKDAYVYVKYAETIVMDAFGNPIAEQCQCTANSGESTKNARWMGIGNGSNPNDPVIDKTDTNNYLAENWSKYKWTEFTNPEDVKDLQNKADAFDKSLSDLNTALNGLKNSAQSKEAAEQAIADAKADLEGKLKAAKEALEQSIADGDEALTTELTAVTETLALKAQALNNLEADLRSDSGSVLSAAKIAKLALLAASDEVTIDGGNLAASAIMSAVVEAGIINCSNLQGTTIEGKNIQSTDKMANGDPNWKIDNEGAGWLAKKSIEWDDEGNVTLGENCTINWKSIADAPVVSDGQAGKDGESTFKSMVFLRSTNQPTNAPTGGSYDSPKPTSKFEGKEWSDGIPEGIENLWASTRTFSTNSSKQDATWSVPQLMVDDSDTEFIYTATDHSNATQAKATLPAGFTKNEDGTIDATWLTNAYRAGGWTDDGDVNSIWMATIKKSKGVWGEWTISKIKGEKGDVGPEGPRGPEGPQGTSITVAGEYESESALKAAFPNGDGTNAYIVNGDLYVWVPGTGWKNVGKFTGKDGESTFRATVFKRSETALTESDKPANVDYSDISGPIPSGWSDSIPGGTGEIWSSTATFSTDPDKQRAWSTPKRMTDRADFEVIYGDSTVNPVNPKLPTLPIVEGYAKDGWYDNAEQITDEAGAIYMATASYSDGKWSTWSVAKIKGEKGDQVYLHVKYANSLTYDNTGKITSADWTVTNGVKDGETEGPYIGMYSNYISDDSTNPNDYTWSFIDADKAVTTQLGAHHIYTNLLKGKTVQTTTEDSLILNTEFEQWSEDGKTSTPVTSNGSTVGPTWQLRNDGSGHLAKGNIRWTKEGDVKIGSGVTIEWAAIADAVNENVTAPDGGLTEGQVNEKITTKLSQYNITSDSITGKTISSADGGNAWKIGIDGDGHLANGNIEWDADGNMTVNSINGTVNIGTGEGGPVGIGPWKTYTNDGVTYIGDDDSVSESTNVFASDGTFKLGGGVDEGGIERGADGKIRLGSAVVFENGSDGKVWKLYSDSIEYVYADKQYDVRIFTGTDVITSNYKDVWFKTDDYKKLKAGEQIDIESIVIMTDCGPEDLQIAVNGGGAYSASKGKTYGVAITNSLTGIVVSGTNMISALVSDVIYTDLDVVITKEDLDSWWNTTWDSTTIDGGKIKTGSLDADVIGTGKLKAELIDVDNLTVKSLNTTGTKGYYSQGTINIENNNMSVSSNSASDVEIINITGSSLSGIPKELGTNPASISISNIATTFVDGYSGVFDDPNRQTTINDTLGWIDSNTYDSYKYGGKLLGSVTVANDNMPYSFDLKYVNYYYTTNSDGTESFTAYNVKLNLNTRIKAGLDYSKYTYLGISGALILVPTSIDTVDKLFSELDGQKYDYNYVNAKQMCSPDYSGVEMIELSKNSSDSNNNYYVSVSQDMHLTYATAVREQRLGPGKTGIPAGTYYVYFVYGMSCYGTKPSDVLDISATSTYFSGSFNLGISLYSSATAKIILPRKVNISKCEISEYGFRYIASSDKYVEFTKNGDMMLKNGKTSIRLSSNKMYMSFGDYANSTEYEIKPVYKEWRTTGNNVKSYVLTLGGEL